jgi:hypothetical protein
VSKAPILAPLLHRRIKAAPSFSVSFLFFRSLRKCASTGKRVEEASRRCRRASRPQLLRQGLGDADAIPEGQGRRGTNGVGQLSASGKEGTRTRATGAGFCEVDRSASTTRRPLRSGLWEHAPPGHGEITENARNQSQSQKIKESCGSRRTSASRNTRRMRTRGNPSKTYENHGIQRRALNQGTDPPECGAVGLQGGPGFGHQQVLHLEFHLAGQFSATNDKNSRTFAENHDSTDFQISNPFLVHPQLS